MKVYSICLSKGLFNTIKENIVEPCYTVTGYSVLRYSNESSIRDTSLVSRVVEISILHK